MNVIIRIFIGSGSRYHQNSAVIGVQLLYCAVKPAETAAYLPGDSLHSNGMAPAALQPDVHGLAAAFGSRHGPVRIVVELHAVKLFAGHLAVDVDTSLGVEASYLILPCLYAYFIPAPCACLLLGYLPCDGLESLLPASAAEGVVDHLSRVRWRSKVAAVVVCWVESRVGLERRVLPLYPEKCGGSALHSDVRTYRSRIAAVVGKLLTLAEAQPFYGELSPFRTELQLMGALFQIKEQRLAEKPVNVTEEAAPPRRFLHLCRTHLISAYIRVYVLFVDPYPAESKSRSGIVGSLSVYLQPQLNVCAARDHGAVIRRKAVISRLGHREPIGHLAVGTVPEQCIVPFLAEVVGEAALAEFSPCRGSIVRSLYDYFRSGSGLCGMEVIVVPETEHLTVGGSHGVVVCRHCRLCRGVHGSRREYLCRTAENKGCRPRKKSPQKPVHFRSAPFHRKNKQKMRKLPRSGIMRTVSLTAVLPNCNFPSNSQYIKFTVQCQETECVRIINNIFYITPFS